MGTLGSKKCLTCRGHCCFIKNGSLRASQNKTNKDIYNWDKDPPVRQACSMKRHRDVVVTHEACQSPVANFWQAQTLFAIFIHSLRLEEKVDELQEEGMNIFLYNRLDFKCCCGSICILIKHESCVSVWLFVCVFAFSEATRSPSIIKFWLKASIGPGWVMMKPHFLIFNFYRF